MSKKNKIAMVIIILLLVFFISVIVTHVVVLKKNNKDSEKEEKKLCKDPLEVLNEVGNIPKEDIKKALIDTCNTVEEKEENGVKKVIITDHEENSYTFIYDEKTGNMYMDTEASYTESIKEKLKPGGSNEEE